MAKPRDELLRNAARKHYEKRKAEGKTKLQVWLDHDASQLLNHLTESSPGMSKGDIIARALATLMHREEEEARQRKQLEEGTAEFPA